MLHELTPTEFGRARSLFEGFDYSLSIRAAMEGNSPGRIFVDDVDRPRTALALTVEGYLLAGEDGNPETNDALRRLLKERIFAGEVFVNGAESMSLAVHPATWEARLPDLIPTHAAVKLERYHYLCRALTLDWRPNLPEGYTVRRIDRALLHDPHVVFPEEVREWMDIEQMWWTEDNFLARGVSFVVLHGQEVVTWCVPDCVVGARIDVGIVTHPAHQRRGLAAVAVAATVEHCLAHGFRAVGWHCNAFNVGSWKTAEKVGFERNCEYAYYYYMYDPIDHLAELGWDYYQRGEYARTAHYYDQVFALREENPDYYYHIAALAWARLQDRGKALGYLQAAADHGWRHAAWTRGQEELRILHGTPEWEAILARMEAASGSEP
ncbi:MAG: GNAT family N-acetyltransferase [Anaerolineae bacterium]|nr:GNAT family N-acetyltransferase [Anaerolineae bacterium]